MFVRNGCCVVGLFLSETRKSMGSGASSSSVTPSPVIIKNHSSFPDQQIQHRGHPHPHPILNKRSSSLPTPLPITSSSTSFLTSNPLLHLIQQETHHIRCKILNDIPLSFIHPTIILLYGPPLSDCHSLGLHISQKFNFPIFPTHKQEQQEQEAVVVAVAEAEEAMNEDFYQRIQSSDCLNGFLLINLPQTISQGEEFNLQTKQFKKVVLLIEQDFTVSSSDIPPFSISSPSFPFLLISF